VRKSDAGNAAEIKDSRSSSHAQESETVGPMAHPFGSSLSHNDIEGASSLRFLQSLP
jgi:hypothetical protein